MAEIALLSNQASSLYASSKASGGSDKSAYIYDMKQSSVNKFRERFVRTPLNNASFSGTANCEIPAFGILKQMVLKTTIEYTPASNASALMFSRSMFSQLIDQASIKNSSREIQVIYGDCIKYLVYNMPDADSKKWRLVGKDNLLCGDVNMYSDNVGTSLKRYKGIIKTATTAHTIDVYTVLPFSFFEGFGSSSQYKNCLNTRFLERLSLDVKYNGVDDCVIKPTGNVGATIKIKASELLCSFDVIQDKELQEIESANFSLSQPLAMVLGNWVKHEKEFASNATSQEIDFQLFNTDLVHSLMVVCKKINNNTQLVALADAVNVINNPVIAGNVARGANAGRTMGYGTTYAGALATADATTTTAIYQKAIKAITVPHTNLHGLPFDDATATTVANGRGVSRPGQDLVQIDEITITSAGRELYKSTTHEEGLFLTNTDKRGSCWFSLDQHRHVGEASDLADVNGCSATNMYVIPFGDDDNVDAIRGCLSMKNLNSVKLKLKMNNLCGNHTTDSRYKVCVYVRKYSALSIESNSGRVSVAVST